MNEAFSELFGVVRISEKQLMDFANLLMSICKLDYITVVQNKTGQIIGYGLMAPSISRGVRLGKGRLFPFGFVSNNEGYQKIPCAGYVSHRGMAHLPEQGSERHYHL